MRWAIRRCKGGGGHRDKVAGRTRAGVRFCRGRRRRRSSSSTVNSSKKDVIAVSPRSSGRGKRKTKQTRQRLLRFLGGTTRERGHDVFFFFFLCEGSTRDGTRKGESKERRERRERGRGTSQNWVREGTMGGEGGCAECNKSRQREASSN